MGSHAYFQKTRGTQVVMSLGEAGQIFSPLGLQLQYNNFPMALFPDYPELGTAPCVPDRVILPGEEAAPSSGPPSASSAPRATRWTTSACAPPDDVLYVADAMMTGAPSTTPSFPTPCPWRRIGLHGEAAGGQGGLLRGGPQGDL